MQVSVIARLRRPAAEQTRARGRFVHRHGNLAQPRHRFLQVRVRHQRHAQTVVVVQHHLEVTAAEALLIHFHAHVRLHHAAAHERVHIVVFVGFLQYAQRTFAVRLVRVPHRNRVDMPSHVGTSSVLSCFSLGRSNSPSRPKCSRNLSVVVYRIGRPSVSRRPDS